MVLHGENPLKEREIYLAGGCFWGLEKYLSLLEGVVATEAGYANGSSEKPSYEDVCYRGTGHAETVKVVYDPGKISLDFLLEKYYGVIDPLTKNRQGNDAGRQYRTGIYYTDEKDRKIIEASLSELQKEYDVPVATEALPLENYASAEDYHQMYLDKNPGGYCHIGMAKFVEAAEARDPRFLYPLKSREELRKSLTDIQYAVTQKDATEPPFKNAYHDNFRKGVYVDITTGEPLFVSADKFDSGCGWPSFSKPIAPELLTDKPDNSLGMSRTEVRSRRGNAHLGHVFPDGPEERGGLRYCINSAALRFIPEEDMEKEGCGYLRSLLE